MICQLAKKVRRFFPPDAAAEIWAELKPRIQSIDTMDCFEGLGMLSLLMPCMRVAPDDAAPATAAPWAEWMEEWVAMSQWMPTNKFWLAAWHGLFAQLAKHDTAGVIPWAHHAQNMASVSLSFMEVPVGGSEGACPFGRPTLSRAAYLFARASTTATSACAPWSSCWCTAWRTRACWRPWRRWWTSWRTSRTPPTPGRGAHQNQHSTDVASVN